MSVTDGTVGAPLDKRVPILCQNEADAAVLKKSGFQDITILPKEGIQIGDATIRQVPALHGTYIPCGNAMGVLFEAKEEKTFYLAGDTIWYEEVAATIKKYQPEVIALNACAAETLENGRLIMNDGMCRLPLLMPGFISRIWITWHTQPSLGIRCAAVWLPAASSITICRRMAKVWYIFLTSLFAPKAAIERGHAGAIGRTASSHAYRFPLIWSIMKRITIHLPFMIGEIL